MEKNFNSFKKLQSELEKIPVAKPEAHFIVNDIAEKYLNNEEIEADQISNLEIIWSELQSLDMDLIRLLDSYRSNEIITRNETLIVSSCLLISKQVGPDCEKIIEELHRQELPLEKFSEIAKSISIPSNTREVVINLYNKLIQSPQRKV